ncbi:MAG: antitoxin [Oscillospiraceae bacterium]|nr:antitoxin [Oscillospiraceae bacterium]
MKTISIRLEDTDYEALNDLLSDMGQTKQTFYESYTKTALRERRIPFIISAPLDPFYSESNINRLHHSFRQAESGKVVVKTMEELEAMADE